VCCLCPAFLLAVAPDTVYLSGGFAGTSNETTHTAMNTAPRILNVSGTPTSESRLLASGEKRPGSGHTTKAN
jgi:hypothetical protein